MVISGDPICLENMYLKKYSIPTKPDNGISLNLSDLPDIVKNVSDRNVLAYRIYLIKA